MKGYICLNSQDAVKNNIKILLVYPKVGAEAKVSLHLPISLLYLASYLKDYSVAIYDQRVDPISDFYELLAENPLCVGFSLMTGIQIKHALELSQTVKEKNIPTVFGGVHPTILPEQTLEDERVDYVVCGQGEASFRKFVDSLSSGHNIINPIIKEENVDLNKASLLPYELVNIEHYVHTAAIEGRSLPFLFSRGCPFKCTFCCNPVIHKGKWKTMDVDTAVRLLSKTVKQFDLDGIFFLDENLTVNSTVLNNLAKEINGKFKWMAQARINSLLNYDLNYLEKMGAVQFSCGLESGSPDILKKIKKKETVEEYIEANRRIAETNISTWYNYIIGFPGETLEDVKLTVRLAMQMLDENPRANNSTFYLLTPYPGTEIGEKYFKAEMPHTLEKWADFGRHNFTATWHSPERIKLYSRICFSSKFVGRRILRMFPQDESLKEMMKIMSRKWRDFDFTEDSEWDLLKKSGWDILKRLFGENAY